MTAGPLLFVCDSIIWRMDRFLRAAERLATTLRELDSQARLTVGYRARDDLALLVCDGVGDDAIHTLLESAGLPGLRVLDLPAGGPSPAVVSDNGLRSCDVVVPAGQESLLEAELRVALGRSDDPRAAVRVSARLHLRFEVNGTWEEGHTRDVASGGVFVETTGRMPEVGATVRAEVFSPDEAFPITAWITVVRYQGTGFGCRLTLAPEDERRFVSAVRRARPTQLPDTRRRDPRVPARFAVRFEAQQNHLRTYTANVSRAGLFVRTDTPPPPGTRAQLVLGVPSGEEFVLDARVTHVVSEDLAQGRVAGCGMVFESLSASAQTYLDTYLSMALAKPVARVVVADADAGRRRELASALRAEGCIVAEASSSTDALHRLIDEILALDLFVVGEELADADIGAFLVRLRVGGGETKLPVVALGDASRRPYLQQAGASETISPSLGIPEMCRRILAVVDATRGA